MKKLIITLVLCCAALQAAENPEVAPKVAEEASQLTAKEGAGFLEQLKQTLGAKAEGVQEVRPVVDPSAADSSFDEEGDTDFDFNENAENGFQDEFEDHQQEELSGEEMSEYFADVSANDAESAGM